MKTVQVLVLFFRCQERDDAMRRERDNDNHPPKKQSQYVYT